MVNAVRAGKAAYGGEYGDMLEEGILDPTKVTRLALQNAASVAGLLLTTEVMIAEAPKEDDHSHGAPGGLGGMGADEAWGLGASGNSPARTAQRPLFGCYRALRIVSMACSARLIDRPEADLSRSQERRKAFVCDSH